MKPFSTVIGTLGIVATLLPAPASAQQTAFDLRPGLTKAEFAELTSEIGSVLRFRQLGDATPLGKGNGDVSVQVGNRPTDNRSLGRSMMAFPRVIARFGASDRVDIGAFGGFEPDANYGMAGFDTKIALFVQGPARPVSLAIRPSVTSLIGPSQLLAANASIDVSISRSFGALSPYAGVATTGSIAYERSANVDLDPAVANGSISYAGLSYAFRALVASAEVEKGTRVSYAFRLGTRF
ncbi:MAG TPA: hypothetical protein VFO48_05165 [Vicinamibacterales bacterium]|nr:hypothetical protein [Vicinamibacterales bacterium]